MLRPALIAYGVTLFCVLTPLIHLLTAIPGPFIGGIVGGIQVGPRSRNPMTPFVIGVLLGVLMALTIAVLGSPVFMLLQTFGLLEDKSLAGMMLVPFAIGAYVMILGTAGAFFGLVLSGRKNPTQPDLSR